MSEVSDFKYTEQEREACQKLLHRRELDRRTTATVDVIISWLEGTNVIIVNLADTMGNDLEFAVDGKDALDARDHPYWHADNQGVEYRGPAQ